jgi:hypothetical protein
MIGRLPLAHKHEICLNKGDFRGQLGLSHRSCLDEAQLRDHCHLVCFPRLQSDSRQKAF